MAMDYKQLAQGTLTGGADTLYTVPGATQAIIKSMMFVNYSGVGQTLKVTQGGAADAHTILPQQTLDAGEMFAWENDPITLDAADDIRAVAGAAASITYTIWGAEVT